MTKLFILLALISATVTTACVRADQDLFGNGKKDQTKPQPPVTVVQTPASIFYGKFETLEWAGQKVNSRGTSRAGDVFCVVETEIDNVGVMSARSPAAPQVEYLNKETFQPLKTDLVWVRSGIRVGDAQSACQEFSLPLFADLGVWKTDRNDVTYSFAGRVIERDIRTQTMKEFWVDETVRVRNVGDYVEVSFKFASPARSYDEVWLVKRK